MSEMTKAEPPERKSRLSPALSCDVSLRCQLRIPVRPGLYHCGDLTEFDYLLRRAGRKHVHDTGNHSCPSGLMARAKARAVVAVEILIEQNKISPVRVFLQLPGSSIHRAAAIFVRKKD